MRYYPIFLNIERRPVVVVGGGGVAERKVGALLKAGAEITVVSPIWTRRLERWRKGGKIKGIRRRYRPGDLDRALLAFAATDDSETNRAICKTAGQRGIWVNAADCPGAGQFILPAVLTRGDLTIAVSTGGKSPALAKKIRDDLKTSMEGAWGAEQKFIARLLAKVKRALLEKGVPPRRRREILTALAGSDIGSLFSKGRSGKGWERISRVSGLKKEEIGLAPALEALKKGLG